MKYDYESCKLCRVPLTQEDRQYNFTKIALSALQNTLTQQHGQLCGSPSGDVCKVCRENGSYATYAARLFAMTAYLQPAQQEMPNILPDDCAYWP